jgi:hypothetical protein
VVDSFISCWSLPSSWYWSKLSRDEGNVVAIWTLAGQAEVFTQRGLAATKSEARNSKPETTLNDQNSNDPNKLKTKTRNGLKTFSRNRKLVARRSTK